jgi:hypothetical protein
MRNTATAALEASVQLNFSGVSENGHVYRDWLAPLQVPGDPGGPGGQRKIGVHSGERVRRALSLQISSGSQRWRLLIIRYPARIGHL